MRTQLKIDGLRELRDLLKQLPRRTSAKVMRQSLRKALKPIESEARQRIKRVSGAHAKSIGRTDRTQRGRSRSEEFQQMFVGALRGKKFKAWTHHILEFGYGRQRPQPFLRPSFDNNIQNALIIYRNDLVQKIEKEARKLRGK